MYKIAPMKTADIPNAIGIWNDQFYRYCRGASFPDFCNGGKTTIEQYLLEQIQKGNALIAVKGERVVGYMAWMCFDFHDEPTAFLPIVGNAAELKDEMAIYHALYSAAALKWVRDNRFNHLWMTFYDDTELKEMLYDMGFGSYVIDACQKTSYPSIHSKSTYRIDRVGEADAGALLELGNDSERNLLNSPIFLARELQQREEIVRIINTDHVFAAWDGDRMVGTIGADLDRGYHFEHLTCVDSAYIGGIGAYIRPEYRGKGIGSQLLKQVFECCERAGKPFLHVGFESANPDAMRFWPKYFKPAIRSVRRCVNKDANTAL